MKIWCVDSAVYYTTHSQLFLTKEEAQNEYDQHTHGYCKMYQVEDIWHWCARNFQRVVNEIVALRDNGDGYTLIYNLVNELRETAEHCDVENFSADMIIAREPVDCDDDRVYALGVAWFYENKLRHMQFLLNGLDYPFEHTPLYKKGWERNEPSNG